MGKIFSEASHASFSSTSPLEVIEKCVMNSTKSIVPLPSSSRILKTLNLVYNFPNSLKEQSNFTRQHLLYQIGNWSKLIYQCSSARFVYCRVWISNMLQCVRFFFTVERTYLAKIFFQRWQNYAYRVLHSIWSIYIMENRKNVFWC